MCSRAETESRVVGDARKRSRGQFGVQALRFRRIIQALPMAGIGGSWVGGHVGPGGSPRRASPAPRVDSGFRESSRGVRWVRGVSEASRTCKGQLRRASEKPRAASGGSGACPRLLGRRQERTGWLPRILGHLRERVESGFCAWTTYWGSPVVRQPCSPHLGVCTRVRAKFQIRVRGRHPAILTATGARAGGRSTRTTTYLKITSK